jgi:hypothetical protein
MRGKKVIALGVLLAGAIFLGAIPASGQDRPDRDKVRAIGKVTSIDGNTFTMDTRRRGEIKVTYDDETEWAGGSQSDLKVDVVVAIVGTGTDPINAEKIGFPKEGHRRHHRPRLIRGEITDVGDGQFRLKTRRGEVTVKWNEDTKFVHGASEDIEKGAKVGVAGRRERPEGSETSGEAGALGRRARVRLEIESGNVVVHARVIAFPSKSTDKPAA